jgi:uncharacterized pyridoxamine 5'-phosphate oxidase family protein
MERVYNFLKQCGAYYLATVDGDKARVRPFGTIDMFDGGLYIQSGKVKDVSKQILANPNIEICAFDGKSWMRISAKAIPDERVEAKKHMLDAYPNLRGMYNENDDNTIVFRLTEGSVTHSPYGGGEPEKFTF